MDAHFCPQCTKILSLGRPGDYFAFIGLPRRLKIDLADLEQRFRALSRQFHPDFFYNAPPGERRASLERSSYLNDAYRTLRDPIARLEYLLRIEGFARDAGDRSPNVAHGDPTPMSNAVPPALLEEVFALNEELDEVREARAGGVPPEVWRGRLERARVPIEAKRLEHEAQLEELSARWDAVAGADAGDARRRAVLEALRNRVLERNYINNLLAGIEKEIGADT